MLEAYRQHAAAREAQGIPPLPLTAQQTTELCELLKNPPAAEKEELMMLLRDRVPPGVDEAAYVKAGFLTGIAKGEISCPLISRQGAIDLLGTMVGGYNVQSLVELLKSRDSNSATAAASALSKTTLVFDAFNDVLALSDTNPHAKQVVDAWANATWFIGRAKVPET
ncbi:MAG: aconitate hydratase B, partial [Jaaginema sp. PMC 1078.18]|nr:aconitate hydratase B [Jaaginema sp. PMC 1078.18]